MKRTFLYILAALLAMSCKNNSVQNKNEDDKPVITVTIEPSVISVLNKPGWIS